MRVIAGKCRSMPLKTLKGNDTRPTTDRIKETLFNMIQMNVPGSRFLDLFSGSGGIGIEALSRGAKECVFVEQSRAAAACIRENLNFTGLMDQSELLVMEARSAVLSLKNGAPFDIIFMDPPYDQGLEKDITGLLSGAACVNEDTIIIIEASLQTDFSWVSDTGFEITKYKKYKTNAHVFLRVGSV